LRQHRTAQRRGHDRAFQPPLTGQQISECVNGGGIQAPWSLDDVREPLRGRVGWSACSVMSPTNDLAAPSR
jgi:hypothetical protein